MLSPTVLNSLHSTDAIPPQYWCCPPTCTDATPRSTAAIPPQYWIAFTVLMLSPHMYCSYPSTVLNSLRSTDAISPQYWCYPPAVLMLSPTCTDAIPTCTDAIPPQYWTASAVLNSLRSTDRRYTGCGSMKYSVFISSFSILLRIFCNRVVTNWSGRSERFGL